MQFIVRLSAIILFVFLSSLEVRAADSTSAKPVSAKEDFQQKHAKFNEINAELRILQVEYRKSSKADRPALEKKWKEEFRKGEEIQAEFFQSAEKAYLADPKGNKDLTNLLWNIFGFQIVNDDYENAARLGKILIDNGENNTQGFAMAGVAAVSVGDFKSAAKYFDMAKKGDFFKSPPDQKEKRTENAFIFSQNLAAFEENWNKEQKIREAEANANLPRVEIKTEKGTMVVELFENEAPNTVANFITLVEKKFYDGLTFHRVLPGFMAQGGDPNGDGTGGPGYTIPDEVSNPAHRKHFRGSLSMAKTDRPDSGGSQFFLCFVPTAYLDGKHTVFGRVIDGFDVLAKIQRCDPENPNAADPEKIVEMKVIRKNPDHDYTVKKTGEKEDQ